MTEEVSLDSPEEKVENTSGSSGNRQIRILRPEERKGTISKYLVYIIECDPKPKGVVTVARRYNDFLWLRNTLKDHFQALWCPPLPPKKAIGRFNEEFVEARRKDLERYLTRLQNIPAFANSEAFAMFLSRPESTFAMGCKEMDAKVKGLTWQERTKSLETLFPELHERELPATAEQDVEKLREFMEKCKKELETVLDSCRACLTKHDDHAKEIETLTETFSALYTAEKNYPYRPEPQRINVEACFEQWQAFEKDQTKVFELDFLHTISHEFEDMTALTELLDRRGLAQTRYTKTVAKVQSLKDKPTRTDKQNVTLAEEQKNEESYKAYLDLATKILLFQEASAVWTEKVETFEKRMDSFSNTQLAHTDKMRETWSEALK